MSGFKGPDMVGSAANYMDAQETNAYMFQY